MSGNRRKIRLASAAVSIGCGCRRPKLSDIFRPKSKPQTPDNYPKKPNLYDSSSSNPWYRAAHYSPAADDESTTATAATAATTLSPTIDGSSSLYASDPEHDFPRNFGGGTVAVEKDSDDPYLDFRRSMIHMILEREIYSKDELKELLNCFLQLNSTHHHGIIIRAFTEIWNGIFCLRPPGGAADHPGSRYRHR